MKYIFWLAIFLPGTSLISYSQQDTAARFAAGITANSLKKQLTIIAGEEMEGRETGTEGQRKAAEYIEGQFKALGLVAPKH
jgi:hypothetical protein